MPKKRDEIEELKRLIAAQQAQLAQLEAERAREASTTKTSKSAQAASPATKSARKPPPNIGSTHTDTGGGAVVQGAVRLASGHFIGRDFIGVVNQFVQSGADAEHAKLALASYLHALASELAHPDLGKIDPTVSQAGRNALELTDIYVPLDTTFRLPQRAKLADAAEARDPGELLLLGQAGRRGERQGGNRIERMRNASALEALATHANLTLLGAPGSGKSTFGAYVMLALARAWQGLVPLKQGLGPAWKAELLLPIRVVLRRFAQSLAPGGQAPTAGDLWNFIADELHRSGWGEARTALQAVQMLARGHGALVLFDGLDECGDETRRAQVHAAVQQFVTSAGPKSRFLLTARPYAFAEVKESAPQRGIYVLAELDPPKTEQFIAAWYAALVKRGWKTGPVADALRADLLSAWRRPELEHLARNPLLLTQMAILHANDGSLPRDRADLYGKTVALLLERWTRSDSGDSPLLTTLAVPGLVLGDIERVLEQLAFDVHEANEGQASDAATLADIPATKLLQAFKPVLQDSWDKAQQAVDFIERRAGLLLGLGERAGLGACFSFPHRTYQEFLAARHLRAMPSFVAECRRLAERAPDHWREVLAFAARLAGAGWAGSAVDELLGARDPEPTALVPAVWPRVHVAAVMLAELGPVQRQQLATTRAVTERARRWLVAGLPLHPAQGGAPAARRAALGDLLAELGDPRFDATRLFLPAADPMLGFRRIPGRPGLAVGQYLVTVAQYRCFLEHEAIRPAEPDALGDPANRPVRGINWHEAGAYAAWLQREFATNAALAPTEAAGLVREQGWQVGLPTDAQWEHAARGGLADKPFPWGDAFDPELANTSQTKLGATAAVGSFSPNGYGLFDMAGNLWQWMQDDDPENKDGKLLRGGSFDGRSVVARCAFRDGFPPDFRNRNVGFRVVLRSAPVL
jgi:hypothetical protein